MQFIFKDSLNREGTCDIEHYGHLLVVTELNENKAMSVTNAIERIVNQYASQHELQPKDLEIIERYDKRSYTDIRVFRNAIYAKVTLTVISCDGKEYLANPSWVYITGNDFDDILAQHKSGLYNNITIINNEEVELSDNERAGVASFHKSRLAFAIKSSEEVGYQILINVKDEREHRVYLKEDYNIFDDEFEQLIRGYIKDNSIVFYRSSSFIPVPNKELTSDLINEILKLAIKYFGNGVYKIANGVYIGKPGEIWKPIEIIGEYTV